MKLDPATRRSARNHGIVLSGLLALLVGCVVGAHLHHNSAPVYMYERPAAGSPASVTPTPTASATSTHAVAKPAAVAPRTSAATRHVAPVQPQQAAAPTDSSTPASDPTVDETLPVSQGTVDQGGVTRPPSAAPPVPVTTAPRG